MRDVMECCRRETWETKGAMINHPLDERLPPQGAALPAIKLTVAMQVHSERLNVIVKPELAHRPQHVLSSDGLPLLALATVVGFTGDEADVLGNAFLDGLLGIVRYLGVRGQDFAHDPDHVGDGHEPVLLPDNAFCVVSGSIGRGLVVCLGRRQPHADVWCFHIC